MLQALSYIHASKLLHRDIKTANIFLDELNCVKLGDFGTAKLKHRERTFSTEGMLRFGVDSRTGPEQLRK